MIREYESSEPLILSGNADSEITIRDAIYKICEISEFGGTVEVRTIPHPPSLLPSFFPL